LLLVTYIDGETENRSGHCRIRLIKHAADKSYWTVKMGFRGIFCYEGLLLSHFSNAEDSHMKSLNHAETSAKLTQLLGIVTDAGTWQSVVEALSHLKLLSNSSSTSEEKAHASLHVAAFPMDLSIGDPELNEEQAIEYYKRVLIGFKRAALLYWGAFICQGEPGSGASSPSR